MTAHEDAVTLTALRTRLGRPADVLNLSGIEPGTLSTILVQQKRPIAFTLWTDAHDRMTRLTCVGDAECVLDMPIGVHLATVVALDGDRDSRALLSPAVGELRGIGAIRPAEILGPATAAKLALTWMRGGDLGEGWVIARAGP